MRIDTNNNSTFRGIKLSSNNYEKVKDMANQLNKTGFKSLGYKKIFCNNTIIDKINKFKNIRDKAKLFGKQFGAIFLPWSNEAYIISSPEYEQLMFPVIKQYDKGAILNLSI